MTSAFTPTPKPQVWLTDVPCSLRRSRSMKLFTDDLYSGRSSGALVWLKSISQSYHHQAHHKPPERWTRVVSERKTAWKLKAQ